MKNYNLTLSWSVFKNNELEKSDRMLVEAAKKANATIEKIKSRYILSPEVEQQYNSYVGTKV